MTCPDCNDVIWRIEEGYPLGSLSYRLRIFGMSLEVK